MQKFPTIEFPDLFTTSQIFFTTKTTQCGWKYLMFHFLPSITVTEISGHNVWSLLGLCESDSVLAKIEQRVIWSNEHITKNPQWTTWRWDINADEPTETDCLAHLWDLDESKKNKRIVSRREWSGILLFLISILVGISNIQIYVWSLKVFCQSFKIKYFGHLCD